MDIAKSMFILKKIDKVKITYKFLKEVMII
jgi:hypothetical protein